MQTLASQPHHWIDPTSWSTPSQERSIEALRAEYRRFESTMIKNESVLGFDVNLPSMRPADVVRTTPHFEETSTGYPTASEGGRVDFAVLISRMLEFRSEFDNADLVYLIVDSRRPEEVDFWPAFQPWWASRIAPYWTQS